MPDRRHGSTTVRFIGGPRAGEWAAIENPLPPTFETFKSEPIDLAAYDARGPLDLPDNVPIVRGTYARRRLRTPAGASGARVYVWQGWDE